MPKPPQGDPSIIATNHDKIHIQWLTNAVPKGTMKKEENRMNILQLTNIREFENSAKWDSKLPTIDPFWTDKDY